MSRENFRYVTPEYVSNCMLEAFKAKLKDPRRVKLYFLKPRFKPFRMFHFMWTDGKADYDFSDHYYDPEHNFPPKLFFRGHIRKFKQGFAARYIAADKAKRHKRV